MSRLDTQLVQSWLNDNGYSDARIIVGEYKLPDQKILRLPWPSPPTALQSVNDSEVAAAYVLSMMQGAEASGGKGYMCFAALTSFDETADFGSKDKAGDWYGARTYGKLSAIRKAVYHGLTIAGRMKRELVSSTVQDLHAGDEAFSHFHVLSGADKSTLTILMWNFVSNPAQQTQLKLRDVLGPERERALLSE